MTVDFSKLAPPDIIETLNYEQLLAERKAALIALWPEDEQATITVTLSRESEPLYKLLQESVYREMILRNRINAASRAVLLAFATGNDLDHLAANYNTARLVISPANNSVVPPVSAVMESDEAFKLRILKSFDRLSVAGPRQAYEYHALSADGRVADAKASSPNPCQALITILQHDTANGAATQQLIDIVYTALNDERIRPVGDRVTVQSAQIVNYSINARLYVEKLPENSKLLEQAISRATLFTQNPQRIGRSIYMSALYALLQLEGVTRVQLVSPTADVVVTDQQASFCTGINITFGAP